ncbi:PH domain-containing protein [Corallococcus llansteffanensis]|uniref:PH domain-containing protein n=1 Tax=Corallococcus llansteffanensis TaxID=2316731 RepID=A0A3A8QBS9_9BACT|nr:PH domain-containing protein [Corallococcus llansteffanensis]RKH66056.1 PH domain-containing protein [Corallococcus llansteffanensis]
MDGRERTVEGKQSQQVFRPRRVLAATMAAAGLLWLGVLVYLFNFEGVPLKTFLSAGFFVLFFAVAVTYYGRTRIEVDSRGITCRGMVRTRRFSFGDIRKLDVLPGPVTVYAIRGSKGFVHFTSFFRHHRDLARLLVERAGLSPLPV